MYESGKVVLVPFPFTDFSSQKIRPALIISKTAARSDDIIVLFITSNTQKKSPHSYTILSNHKNFLKTGLKVSSSIRCDKVGTLSKKVILGEIGFISEATMKEIGKCFSKVFCF